MVKLHPTSQQSRSLTRQKGVAAVELAIILPVLMLVLFAIVTFGTMFYNQIVITNAAREGARWGSIHAASSAAGTLCNNSNRPAPGAVPTSPCELANRTTHQRLINYGGNNTAITQAIVTAVGDDKTITVTVSVNYQGLGFLRTLFAQGLSASATMYLEPVS